MRIRDPRPCRLVGLRVLRHSRSRKSRSLPGRFPSSTRIDSVRSWRSAPIRASRTSDKGAKTIRGTGVWAGEPSNLHRVQAGQGACDPAWSPDGQRLAVTAAEGLWVFPANSAEGDLRVESKFRSAARRSSAIGCFHTRSGRPTACWSALVVSNGGTSWVEVFEANSGRLFYTSPPENYSFSWSAPAHLKLGQHRNSPSQHDEPERRGRTPGVPRLGARRRRA